MGDRRKHALGVQSDGKLKLKYHGTEISSDASLLSFRELDDAFGLTERGSTVLPDPRRGKNIRRSKRETIDSIAGEVSLLPSSGGVLEMS